MKDLKHLGLITDETTVLSGRASRYTVLTETGRIVAEKLVEIARILELDE